MDSTTAQQYLAEAEAARHARMTGQMPSMIGGPNGSMARFMEMPLADLNNYIAQLKRDISPRRPILFEFPR